MTTHTALELSRHLDQLLASERGAMVDFILALAEFNRRQLWVELGHRTLFDYLTRALRLSESSAFYRKTAAELVGRFPAVIDRLRDGRVCITNLVKLRDVLTPENCESILAQVEGKPKREVEALVAACAPLPARRDVLCAVPALPMIPFEKPQALPASIAPAPLESTEPAPVIAPIKPDRTEPLSRELHRLHVTVSSEFMRDLDEAKAAMSHKGSGSLEAILREGLRLILKEHRKRKALTDQPRASRAGSNERYIPAAVRRAVWIRDKGCCQWPLVEGGVCASREQLQYHHVLEHARGGEATVENLKLLCRTHNLLAAEKSYGADFMKPFRNGSAQFTSID